MKENENTLADIEFQCGECEQWMTPEEIAYGHDCEAE